ncbi:MAG: transcriptional regulator, HxlR family [Clostridiales bacterium]|jgi:DNA-binding HxlR family transcriptional regulator|nr:transcriptional regulator, HxlR family [Clostridiales bacterium]
MKEDLFGVCPLATAQELLTGKWTLLILYLLSKETLRFNELHRKLPVLTQSTLSKQLRILEANGIIIRKVYQEIPPKVEYSLSDIGKGFQEVLISLEKWGNQYIEYLKSR